MCVQCALKYYRQGVNLAIHDAIFRSTTAGDLVSSCLLSTVCERGVGVHTCATRAFTSLVPLDFSSFPFYSTKLKLIFGFWMNVCPLGGKIGGQWVKGASGQHLLRSWRLYWDNCALMLYSYKVHALKNGPHTENLCLWLLIFSKSMRIH